MKRNRLLIFFLFSLNALVRFYGIWFSGFAWDEEQYYIGARQLGKFFYHLFDGSLYLDPQFVSIYGPVGKYLSFLGLSLYEMFAYWWGYDADTALLFIRFFSSFIPSVVTVWLLYSFAKKYDGEVLAIWTLLFSAFAFRWVEAAHYAVPDSLTALFVVAVLYLLMQKGFTRKQWFWLAFLIALAFHTKIHIGGLLIVFVSFLLLWQMKIEGKIHIMPLIWFGFLLLFWILIIGFPYLYFIDIYIEKIVYHLHEFPFIVKGSPLSYFYFRPVMGVDFGLLGLALMGLFLNFRHRRNIALVLNAFWLLLFYVYLSFSRGAIPRWEIPLIPSLVLLAASGTEKLMEFRILRKLRWIALLLLMLILARPAYHIVMLNAGYVHRKPLTINQWFENHQCKRVFNNFSFDYPKLSYFLNSDCNCAVISEPYWNDLETNGVPSWLENPANNASFIGLASDSIRIYVRHHWNKSEEYIPRFFTPWTFNPALPKKITLYVRE